MSLDWDWDIITKMRENQPRRQIWIDRMHQVVTDKTQPNEI